MQDLRFYMIRCMAPGINTIKMLLPNADEIHGDYNPSFGDIDHPEPIDEVLTVFERNCC